ncbi:MAG: 50S ribosomal protein L11 methyltransferase, partial [Leptolyngbya sp. Prado105]|nr:50S ribosomal protein L11 methyltransferase [Leptolyngbya sp. Prado105]
MSYIELSLDATEEAIDWIRSLLTTVDYSGELHIEKASAPWAFHVRFYLSDRALVNPIKNALSSLHRTGMTTELESAIVDQKIESTPETYRIGNRFVIGTANHADDITLNIQESLAFGSGFHPATILSLRLIEKHVTPNLEVLDLGCGSGILSVAIAVLGAKVLAIDNDAIAVKATQQAVQQNAVSDLVTIQMASLGKG